MNMDYVKKELQSFFDADTVTIVGSGLSYAEGIPGMADLANELIIRIPKVITDKKDKLIWNNIQKDLILLGLEEALQRNIPTQNLEILIRSNTAEIILESEDKVLDDVINGIRELRISKYLKCFNISDNGLSIITTNYDRLIEYGCAVVGIQIENMFTGQYIASYDSDTTNGKFAKNIRKSGKNTIVDYCKRINLYKPHGCLSWFMINGRVFSIPSLRRKDCLIITPGLNKYKAGYSSPFDLQRERGNGCIDKSGKIVAIGYGFNDEHLETHLTEQIRRGKKLLVITYELTLKAKNIVGDHDNVYACYHGEERGVKGTYIKIKNETYFVSGKELWDISKLVEEIL